MRIAPPKVVIALAVIGTLVFSSGCSVIVDLSSAPSFVKVGQEVDFSVKHTNQSTCPIGGVITLILPFVPSGILIDKIEDDELREHLSEFVDAFCTDGTLIPDDTEAECALIDGQIVCTVNDQLIQLPQEGEEVALARTDSGSEVSCQSSGSGLTCTVPKAMVDMGREFAAAQSASAGSGGGATLSLTICEPVDGIVICFTPLIGAPMGMETGTFSLPAPQTGTLNSFALSFALADDGVCRGPALPSQPCDGLGSSCFIPPANTIPNGTCQPGICRPAPVVSSSSGSAAGDVVNNGFGCDLDIDCNSGNCVQCDLASEEFVFGLSCTQTSVAQPAPAMSTWGMAAIVLALISLVGVGLRRVPFAR